MRAEVVGTVAELGPDCFRARACLPNQRGSATIARFGATAELAIIRAFNHFLNGVPDIELGVNGIFVAKWRGGNVSLVESVNETRNRATGEPPAVSAADGSPAQKEAA
jgi:hypothetical protein